MVRLRRWANRSLSAHFPEKRLFIQSGNATRYIRLTPVSQLMLGTATLASVAWMAVATATVVTDLVGAGRATGRAVVLHEAYRIRLDEMATERDRRAAEARSAQGRFQVAMQQIGRQQTELLESVEERRELATALDLMRARLQDAVAQRDAAADTSEQLAARLEQAGPPPRIDDGADLADTLSAVSGVLSTTVAERDAAVAEREDLAKQLANLEVEVAINAQRQNDMVAQLEQAVALSFGPLEKMFESSALDVDTLLAAIRGSHHGQGGPLIPASLSSRSYGDDGTGTRFDRLMVELDRMNLLRIAAGKIPYTMPVRAGYRFTSGFGYRRDPKGGGRRMHAGIDMAGPRGTPIYATADGVVAVAERESGYGNVVRIRHDFGFETVYAHQNKIRVRPGQQVSRGEHIGDMGSTGRSTGVHLHYEVHLNGRPVNPMTYLEAAKNVF
jgi:murein DD-endopeptidase MepM/ murein hydrolase activator NlpD